MCGMHMSAKVSNARAVRLDVSLSVTLEQRQAQPELQKVFMAATCTRVQSLGLATCHVLTDSVMPSA